MQYQQLIQQLDIEKVILFQIERTSKIAKLYSQREFDRLGLNITVEQWILLKIIHESIDLSQKSLADKSLRDPASITRTLDILEKKRLIDRVPIIGNRRQYHISLTSDGQKFIKKHLPIVTSHRNKSMEGLSEQDLMALERILKKIQANMA